jgi:colanic acid biosynthesis glycosyl transferase WcaI
VAAGRAIAAGGGRDARAGGLNAVHILFLTDNFPPETNAPATRTHEHTKRWVKAGHEVTVITGAPNFPSGKIHAGYRNRPWQEETLDGVRVIRVWTYITANEGFLKRTLDYVSFMITGGLAGLFVKRPDVIVATSPQFFNALGGCLLSIVRRRPFVFELRDLWPDSIAAVGAMQEGAAIRFLRKVEYWLYRRAARIVSVTHSFKEILVRNGIPAEKIVVVPNGVDPEAFTPGPKPAELEQRLGLEGKFVAAYVGTIGMAHGLGTILDAAQRLKAREDIAFVLVGTGAEHAKLEAEARARGLGNLHFVGAVSKAEVKNYWRLCDVALVLLRDLPLFRHVIPSKIFEAWGTGRPVILGVAGESAGIVETAGGGVVIPPEDAGALAEAITEMASQRAAAAEAGLAGRRYAESAFSRDRLASEMLSVLQATQSPRT